MTMLKFSGEFRLFTGYGAATEVRAPDSGCITLYERTKAGVAELFYKNDANVERDLSLVGGALITGTGVANQLAIFTGAQTIGGDTDLTFVTDTLTATKIVGSTSITTPSLTDSGMTPGSVLLAGTGGLVSQNNTGLNFVSPVLTLGTVVTANALVKVLNTGSNAFSGIGFSTVAATKASIVVTRSHSGSTSAAVQNLDALGSYDFSGYFDGTFNAKIGAQLLAAADATFTSTVATSHLSVLTVPAASAILTEAARFQPSGALSVGSTTDPGAAGIVDVLTGYRIGNAAASGNVLRGDGTNFVSSPFPAINMAGQGGPWLEPLDSDYETPLPMPLWGGGTISHASLSGLLADDHTQYLLLAGRSGGQVAIGGTAASNTLTLKSTSNATKGKVIFGNAGTTAYDEVNERLGVGTASPTYTVDAVGDARLGVAGGAAGSRIIGRGESTSAPAGTLAIGEWEAAVFDNGATPVVRFRYNDAGSVKTIDVGPLV